MSEIAPASLISQYYLNKRAPDLLVALPQKPSDTRIQDVVLSYITKVAPSVLFVSASAPEVVLELVADIEERKKRKRSLWKKRSDS